MSRFSEHCRDFCRENPLQRRALHRYQSRPRTADHGPRLFDRSGDSRRLIIRMRQLVLLSLALEVISATPLLSDVGAFVGAPIELIRLTDGLRCSCWTR
jgi:hypothetical protein